VCRSGAEESNSVASSAAMQTAKRIVFYGDSLTSGFTLPESQAYPALIQQQIAAHGLPYAVENSGISGNTSKDGLRRIGKELQSPIAVFVWLWVLTMLSMILRLSRFVTTYRRFLNRVKAVSPGG